MYGVDASISFGYIPRVACARPLPPCMSAQCKLRHRWPLSDDAGRRFFLIMTWYLLYISGKSQGTTPPCGLALPPSGACFAAGSGIREEGRGVYQFLAWFWYWLWDRFLACRLYVTTAHALF